METVLLSHLASPSRPGFLEAQIVEHDDRTLTVRFEEELLVFDRRSGLEAGGFGQAVRWKLALASLSAWKTR